MKEFKAIIEESSFEMSSSLQKHQKKKLPYSCHRNKSIKMKSTFDIFGLIDNQIHLKHKKSAEK